MNSLFRLFSMIFASTPTIIAGILAYNHIQGWGWFLFVGGLTALAAVLWGAVMLAIMEKVKNKD